MPIFHSEQDATVYNLAQEFAVHQVGSVETCKWQAHILLTPEFAGRDAIVTEDDQGFVTVEYLPRGDAYNKWEEILTEHDPCCYRDDYGIEPDEPYVDPTDTADMENRYERHLFGE